MGEVVKGTKLEFDYVNWKGVKGRRKVGVWRVFYGATEYHPEPQWLLEGFDIDKGNSRIFAMNDMSNVVDITLS